MRSSSATTSSSSRCTAAAVWTCPTLPDGPSAPVARVSSSTGTPGRWVDGAATRPDDAVGRAEPSAGRVGDRQRPPRREQRVENGTEAADVVGGSQVGARQREAHLGVAVGRDADALGVVAAQHQPVPVGLLGGRGERHDRAGGGERLDQPIGDRLGEAPPRHPLGDGRPEDVVGHAGGAGGEHVEQAGAAGMLEAAGAQRPHDHLARPRGAGGVGLTADRAAFGGEPAQHGDADIALQDRVLLPARTRRPPRCRSRRGW